MGSCSVGSSESNAVGISVKAVNSSLMPLPWRYPVFPSCDCLVSFLMASSPCMIALQWHWLMSSLETVYKMLNFLISLLGVRHSLFNTS